MVYQNFTLRKAKTLRFLITIEHPAWAYQFKHIIHELERQGHKVKVLAINKDRDLELLDSFNIPYEIISNSSGKGTLEKGLIFLYTTFRIWSANRTFKPDVYIGRASPMMSINAFLNRKRQIVFEDSEPVYFCLLLSKWFTSIIITPEHFSIDLGSKQVRIPSYKELFYLHPDLYHPNPDILKILGVQEDEPYSIVRFVSWQAHHDIGKKGIPNKKELVKTLEIYGRVFITSEAPLDPELEGYRIKIPIDRIHDALYYARLFFSDSQTMTTEAAILGTPAIRCNTFVGKNDMANFIEVEQKYGLIYNFSEITPAVEKAKELLSSPTVKDEWAEKRKILLSQKIDPNKIFLEMTLNATK